MLMSTIDDIKLKLTDMEYKTLCDQMAELHKTNDKTEGYCELKFARFLPYIDIDAGQSYKFRIKVQRLIIKMNCDMSELTSMVNKIEQSGSYLITMSKLADIVGDHAKGRALWHEYMCGHSFVIRGEKYEDDDEDGPISHVETSHINLQDAHSVPVISIKML
jgi:hypothetical protein